MQDKLEMANDEDKTPNFIKSHVEKGRLLLITIIKVVF